MRKPVLFIVAVALSSTAVTQDVIERRSAPVPLIPGNQFSCVNDGQSTTSTTFVNIPNTPAATINNGTATRNVVVTFSAEAFTDPGELLIVHFRIDGVIQDAVGPEFFAHDEPISTDTHTIVSVFSLGPGNHFIRPVFRSGSGGRVSIAFRCLVVEGLTS